MESQRYPAALADFGSKDPDSLYASDLNLMLPPASEMDLCNYPEQAISQQGSTTTSAGESSNENNSVVGVNNSNVTKIDQTQFIYRDNVDVALFVSFENEQCSVIQKARVALDLQRNFTRYGNVTHLIIYNTDINRMDDLYTLTADEELDGIRIVFVSTRTGQEMFETIEEEALKLRVASPYLMAEGNELWFFPVSFRKPSYEGEGGDFQNIDPYNDNFDDPGYSPPRQTPNSRQADADDFYWFRLVVFSILVVSPCFRAAYLWYAGGARIRFRYNDEGRIVGLQYIPPMPYWFAPRPEEPYGHAATRMTEEQVLALPEIIYTGSSSATEPYTYVTTGHQPLHQEQQQHSSTTPQLDLQDENNTTDENDTKKPAQEHSLDVDSYSPNTVSNTVDEEQPPESLPNQYTEINSTCSICIDDFEAGERLRVLPRCRHVFHTDCILPWLTERQGCCPLCKTEVMEPENGEDSVHSADPREHESREPPQRGASDDDINNSVEFFDMQPRPAENTAQLGSANSDAHNPNYSSNSLGDSA